MFASFVDFKRESVSVTNFLLKTFHLLILYSTKSFSVGVR